MKRSGLKLLSASPPLAQLRVESVQRMVRHEEELKNGATWQRTARSWARGSGGTRAAIGDSMGKS
jgi:hypothetical protein